MSSDQLWQEHLKDPFFADINQRNWKQRGTGKNLMKLQKYNVQYGNMASFIQVTMETYSMETLIGGCSCSALGTESWTCKSEGDALEPDL